MTDNDNDNGVQQMNLAGEPADGEMTDAEMRRQMQEAVGEHDGVFLVAASLEDSDDDGEADGVSVTVARFIADEVDDDEDKASLMAHIAQEAMENAVPGGQAKAIPVSGDGGGLEALLGALASGGMGVEMSGDADDDADSASSDADTDRMFQ